MFVCFLHFLFGYLVGGFGFVVFCLFVWGWVFPPVIYTHQWSDSSVLFRCTFEVAALDAFQS